MAVSTVGLVCGGVAAGGLVAFWAGQAWVEYRRRSYVAAHGVSVVGWVVQANTELFGPGGGDAPAQLLLSFDAPDGEGLEGLAAEAGRLKFEAPATDAERAVADVVRVEAYRPGVWRRLPGEFTGGPVVYAVDVMVERRLLPGGLLTGRRLPGRAGPGGSGRVYLEPADSAP